MDKIDEQLEESLAFMREQFKPLTRSIPIPESLHADLLRERLDVLIQEREEQPKPQGKLVQFPWKPVMSVAACLVIAVGSYSVYEQNNKSAPQLMTANDMAASSTVADAPMQAAAGVAEEAGEPVADIPMDAAMFSVPEPENMTGGEPVADLPMDGEAGAVTPESAMVDGASPKMRGAVTPDADATDRKVICPRGSEPLERYETLEQAHNAPLGAYLPTAMPQNTQMMDAFLDEERLFCLMEGSDPATGALRYLNVTVRTMTPDQQAYVVDPADPTLYDLRQYPTPWAESVPRELRWITSRVIFRATELTPALIEARITTMTDSGAQISSGNFSVLYEDQTVVSYQFMNLKAQEVMDLVVKP